VKSLSAVNRSLASSPCTAKHSWLRAGVVCPDFFGPLGSPPNRENKKSVRLCFSPAWKRCAQGYAYVIIGWAGPVRFFEKSVGAKVIENSGQESIGNAEKSRGKIIIFMTFKF
jgi:hypothetical protein